MTLSESERRMELLKVALPYAGGGRRQAMEMVLQTYALLHTARKDYSGELEACDLNPDPEGMLLQMQQYCTPREADMIQMLLNFLKAGHLFQSYRQFAASHAAASGTAGSDFEAADYPPSPGNPFGMLFQMINGLGSMSNPANLVDFLMTQLPPEQRQMLEQLRTLSATEGDSSQPPHDPTKTE